jgi:arylsulfatase A-like enzyme
VNWISRLAKLNQSNIDANDFFYRSRLQALQGVDELVDELISRLTDAGILDNTYIIYASDNGFHISQHRLQPGKECGFEEDIRVPLFIRGPGIPADQTEAAITTHIDLAPTVFKLAGLEQRNDFDGVPVPIGHSGSKSTRHEHANVEFWGLAIPEGEYNDFGRSAAFVAPLAFVGAIC